MTKGKPELQVQLSLLVMKKAELEVDAEELERYLLFLGNMYKDIKSVHHQHKVEKPMPYSQFKRTPKTSLLRGMPLAANSTRENDNKLRDMGMSMVSNIRKDVPIEEMIARIRASPLNLPRQGTSREGSWIEHTEVRMTGSRVIKEVGTERHAVIQGLI
jgi:hypothetical protein